MTTERLTFLFRMTRRLLLKLSIQNRLGQWRGTEWKKYKENNHYLAILGTGSVLMTY